MDDFHLMMLAEYIQYLHQKIDLTLSHQKSNPFLPYHWLLP